MPKPDDSANHGIGHRIEQHRRQQRHVHDGVFRHLSRKLGLADPRHRLERSERRLVGTAPLSVAWNISLSRAISDGVPPRSSSSASSRVGDLPQRHGDAGGQRRRQIFVELLTDLDAPQRGVRRRLELGRIALLL